MARTDASIWFQSTVDSIAVTVSEFKHRNRCRFHGGRGVGIFQPRCQYKAQRFSSLTFSTCPSVKPMLMAPTMGVPMGTFLGALPAERPPCRAIVIRCIPSLLGSPLYKSRAGVSFSIGSKLIQVESMNMGVNTEFSTAESFL